MSLMQTSQPAAGHDFEQDVRSALVEIRRSLGLLFAALGLDADGPTSVSRHLSIDKNLAWKACRMVSEQELSILAQRIPGKSGINILCEALRVAGADADALTHYQKAVENFSRLTQRHAGDRESVAVMLRSDTRSAQQQQEADRRLAFVGNSAIFGVRARVHLCSQFVAPSRSPGKLDLAVAAGFLGFERLRPDVPWTLATAMRVSDTGQSLAIDAAKTLSNEQMSPEGDHPPIVREFCSEPLPQLRTLRNANGGLRIELTEGGIGRTAAADVLLGWTVIGQAGGTRQPDDEYGDHMVHVGTPAESLILSLHVHKDLPFAMNPLYAVYNALPAERSFPMHRHDIGRLPITADVVDLGYPADLTTPVFMRYPQLVDRVVSVLGYPADDFRCFRVTLKYPPIPTVHVLRYRLPES